MTLREIKYIVALSDTRHFGKAAGRCFVTQSTLSVQLKRLEESLGGQLFNRDKPIKPTLLGMQIIPLARMMLSIAEEITSLANIQGGDSATID